MQKKKKKKSNLSQAMETDLIICSQNYFGNEFLKKNIAAKSIDSFKCNDMKNVIYLGGTVSLVLNFSILGGLSPSPVALLHKSIASRQLAYSRKDM